jgi:hypothetical protein
MSKENPTPDEQIALLQNLYAAYNPTADELSAILQHQYGSYGVELPEWYVNHVDSGTNDNDTSVIPPEAVSAAAIAIRKADGATSASGENQRTLTDLDATELALAALKAAEPIMFAKMQEQQAQLDAVKAQIEIWEKQPMGGNDLAAITARFAFQTVCKRLRAALDPTS